MIVLTVTFCLVLNQYACRSLEMIPDDGHKVVSQMECIKGGAIGGMTFTLDHADWAVRGWRCIEKPPTDFQQWLSQRQ